MLRVPSPLPDDLEKLVHDTIGCCITVHRTLGPGLLEMIYSRAIALELKAAGIAEHLTSLHDSQLLNYMRVARLRVGLLMNFNVAVLRDGLKRKIL